MDMSKKVGTLLIVIFSGDKSTAHNICRASFLAPCGCISPFNFLPPSMINELILFTVLVLASVSIIFLLFPVAVVARWLLCLSSFDQFSVFW